MSATPPRLTSPISPGRTHGTPGTPNTGPRRDLNNVSIFPRTVEETSPSSTLSGSVSGGPLRLDTRLSMRNIPGVPTRALVVRADPSMLTCFDPADKELYDLWAPSR
ncbi:unnamed protein product [Cyclocybe aegerita]|uniref:Uncharacterized protein n=1 Tax=Cyclocybe aegerita TaxID=1973307 RepID=A0A8S0XEE3_CYCAE|nr:unnamed protein product [Cyclocybe aegerita]